MKPSRYISTMTHPLKFCFAMLYQLPSAVFWGMRINTLNETECMVSLPYRWSTKNPFKSTYFAALSGAGELATGALAQLAVIEKGSFSMLVVGFKAEFYKKADQKVFFHCRQGAEVRILLDQLQKAGDSGQITLFAEGLNKEKELVAKISVTWSFKRRKV
ncbi:MAG: PaaI family thioesterase [Flavobacteriales bacterium]